VARVALRDQRHLAHVNRLQLGRKLSHLRHSVTASFGGVLLTNQSSFVCQDTTKNTLLLQLGFIVAA
jgi:hypothetical protein